MKIIVTLIIIAASGTAGLLALVGQTGTPVERMVQQIATLPPEGQRNNLSALLMREDLVEHHPEFFKMYVQTCSTVAERQQAKSQITDYANAHPGTSATGKGYYELACQMRRFHDADRPLAASVFKTALPMLQDSQEIATAHWQIVRQDAAEGKNEEALLAWLDFLKDYSEIAARDQLHCVFTQYIPDLMRAVVRTGDENGVLDQVAARISEAPESLRVPYQLVEALRQAESGKVAEARALLTPESLPAEGVWAIRRDVLAMYCAFLEGDTEGGTVLLNAYIASGDEDDWIVHNAFKIALALYNRNKPAEALLIHTVVEQSPIFQDPNRKNALPEGRLSQFYYDYAMFKGATGDMDGHWAMLKETYEKYPTEDTGRWAGSRYSLHLLHLGDPEGAQNISRQILSEADDFSDGALEANIILTMIDCRNDKCETAETRLNGKRAQIQPGTSTDWDRWVEVSGQVMAMEARQVEMRKMGIQSCNTIQSNQGQGSCCESVNIEGATGTIPANGLGEPVSSVTEASSCCAAEKR